jgi:WD40 repeat protein
VERLFAFRADHMVLDAAVRGSQVLVARYQVGLLRVTDGRIAHRLLGHTAPVRVLLFQEEGAKLISAGSDGRVLVWNIAGDPKRTHQ